MRSYFRLTSRPWNLKYRSLYTYIYVDAYIFIYTYIYVDVYVYIYVYIYIYIYIYTYIHKCENGRAGASSRGPRSSAAKALLLPLCKCVYNHLVPVITNRHYTITIIHIRYTFTITIIISSLLLLLFIMMFTMIL